MNQGYKVIIAIAKRIAERKRRTRDDANNKNINRSTKDTP